MSKHYEKRVSIAHDCFYRNDTNINIMRIKDIFNRLRKVDNINLNELHDQDPYEYYMSSGNEKYIKRIRDMFKKYNKMDKSDIHDFILNEIKNNYFDAIVDFSDE